jgi:hypothetical protein
MHVNRRCQVTTVDGVVVIFVDGAAWITFDEDDAVPTSCNGAAGRASGGHAYANRVRIRGSNLAVDRFGGRIESMAWRAGAQQAERAEGSEVHGRQSRQGHPTPPSAWKSATDIAAKLGISPQTAGVRCEGCATRRSHDRNNLS